MFSKPFVSIVTECPESLTNDRKFDLALRGTPARQLQQKLTEGEISLNVTLGLLHHSKDNLLSREVDPTLWPRILTKILSESAGLKDYSQRKTDKTVRVSDLIRENMKFQHSYLNLNNLTKTVNDDQAFSNWLDKATETDPLIRNLVFLEEQFGLLVEKAMALEHRLRDKKSRQNPNLLKRHTVGEVKAVGLTVTWTKTTCAVDFEGKEYLLPLSYILMIHNKICDLLSSLMLIHASCGICYETGAYKMCVSFITQLADLAASHPNYHDIAKSLEGIVIGEVLLAEEEWHNDELIRNINVELLGESYQYFHSRLEEIIREASTPLKHELAGFAKVCGHPLIDMKATAAAAEDRAITDKEVDYVAIMRTRNIALESFIRSYVVRNGSWPPVTLDDFCPAYLIDARDRGLDPRCTQIVGKHPGPKTVDDYIFINLEKVETLDKLEHYSQYLKDKALSVLRDQAVGYYIDKTISHIPWEETRLLLVHLFTSEMTQDLEGYLSDYSDSLDDVLNYLVVKLVPKEKELKTIGRPFGCKTYKDRFRSCLQEENVKSFLDKYNSDQAMTLDNLALIKRMHSFRNLSGLYKNWRILYINFDVSGWCGNFRHETVEPIATDLLDAVYGTKHFFGKTQLAYERSFFYLPDPSGTYHWEGQDGGIEGLNQYTWMTVYIPQMQYALRQFGLRFFVMCYGDDYKAALLIPPDQNELDVPSLKRTIVETVANTARIKFGQKMKYYDSYGSEAYVSFCKYASVRAVEMPQGVRKIQKCYGATNAFLPTLDDYIASAFSNAHSATRTMPCTYPAYTVALFWSYYHLVCHIEWSGVSNEGLLAAMLAPSSIGGFPTLHLGTFHTRAENDHLPVYMDMYYLAVKIRPRLADLMRNTINFEIVTGPTKMEMLMRDPYAVPVARPPAPDAYLRSQILPAIRSRIANQELLCLMQAADEGWTSQLIECMVSGPELHPRLYSSIYACTPKALIDEMMKRFETAKTIKDLVLRSQGIVATIKMLRDVFKKELALQSWRVQHLTKPGQGHCRIDHLSCPTAAAQLVRRLWGGEVVGVTMPPVSHLVVLVQPEWAMLDPHSLTHHFHYATSQIRHPLKRGVGDHWGLGDHSPFLGHRTRLGAELPQVKILDNNPFLAKIRTLLDILSWIDQGDESAEHTSLRSVIVLLIGHYYTGDVRDLLPFGAQKKSGTVQHHWRSPHYSEHIMPNTLYNTYTMIKGESNTHLGFRQSADHYTVNFLQVFCHVVHLIQHRLEYGPYLDHQPVYWAVTVECPTCMAPIREPAPVVRKTLLPAPSSCTLAGLTITPTSRRYLDVAAGDLLARGPRVVEVGDPSVPGAVQGVIQRLMEQSSGYTRRVTEYFESPSLSSTAVDQLSLWTTQGTANLVGEREIRGCPTADLARALLSEIHTMVESSSTSEWPAVTQANNFMTNPRGLPWYPAVSELNKAGVLGEVIREVKDITNASYPICDTNPFSGARYLGLACQEGFREAGVCRRFTVLSYYEDDDTTSKLLRYTQLIKRHILWSEFKPHLLDVVRSANEELITDIVSAMVLLATCPMSDMPDPTEKGPWVCLDLFGHSPETVLDEWESDIGVVRSLKGLFSRLSVSDYYSVQEIEENWDTFTGMLLQPVTDNAKVMIEFTNLAACLRVVRAQPRPKKPPISRTHQGSTADVSLGESVCDPEYCALSPEQDGGELVESLVFPTTVQIFPEDLLLAIPYGLSRPYGAGTLSINKILEVCAIIGLDPSSCSGFNIMCLAEGYGGILDLFAKLNMGCHFFFNTIPDDVRLGATPSLAIQAIQQNHHSLDDTLVNTSVFDLTDCVVAEAICRRDSHMYQIVTMDAETTWNEPDKYIRLVANTVRIFLEKRSPEGVLIMKVLLEQQRALISALSRLNQYCNKSGCLRLRSSPPGGEVYVFAYGTKRQFLRGDKVVGAVPNVAARVVGLTETLKRYWASITPPNESALTISVPPQLPLLRKLAKNLETSFIAKVMSQLGIFIDQDKLPDTPIEAGKAILKRADEHLKLVEREWRDSDTAAGIVVNSQKILGVRSFATYMRRLCVDRKRLLLQSEIREDYARALSRIALRLQISEDQMFDRTTVQLGYPCSAYSHWLDGFQYACQAYTYLYHIR